MSNKEGRDVVWRDIGVYFFPQILTSICGWVIPGLSSKEGQIDVCFPAINDGVGFFRRCLGFSLIRHGYLCNERQRNKTRWRCCIDFHIHSLFDSRYENNEHRETNERYKIKIFLCYSSWDISFIWFEVCNVQRENKAKWKCGTALYHRNSIHHLIWGGRIMRYKTPNSLWSAINAPFLISPSLLAIIQASSSILSSRVFGVLLALKKNLKNISKHIATYSQNHEAITMHLWLFVLKHRHWRRDLFLFVPLKTPQHMPTWLQKFNRCRWWVMDDAEPMLWLSSPRPSIEIVVGWGVASTLGLPHFHFGTNVYVEHTKGV